MLFTATPLLFYQMLLHWPRINLLQYGQNIYHIHQGKWSEGAEQNRTLFQEVQLLAKQELEDPERVAYWQPLFEKQFKHPKQGEKHYATLRGFVIAQIHQQVKKEQVG